MRRAIASGETSTNSGSSVMAVGEMMISSERVVVAKRGTGLPQRPSLKRLAEHSFVLPRKGAYSRRMVEDLHMDIDIVMMETIREPDGLAMSSRNNYLTPEQRKQASQLYKALDQARKSVREGERDFYAIGMRGIDSLQAAGFRPEYFAIRRADNLMTPEPEDSELRVLAAAWLGPARLIDNVAV